MPLRFLLEAEMSKFLSMAIGHDVGVLYLDLPRRRKAARVSHWYD